jgi:hypothetical protein
VSAKYTPGPWLLVGNDYGDREIIANGKALMCDTQYYPWCPDDSADWSLIAAAPELLEALQKVESACSSSDSALSLSLAMDALIEEIRAAIQKATAGENE